jgi:hypothetical protein
MMIIGLVLQYSWVLFVVALVTSIWSQQLFQQGNFARGKKILVVSFWCAAVLAVTNGVVGFVARDGMSLFMAAIWAYFAWRDQQILKRLGG